MGHGAGHPPLLTLGLGGVQAEVLLAQQHHPGPPAQLLCQKDVSRVEKTTQTAPGPSILL